MIHGSSGLVVPPKSPEGLGKALLSLASDKGKQRKYGRRAKNIVQQKFSVKNVLKNTKKSTMRSFLEKDIENKTSKQCVEPENTPQLQQ